MTKWKRREMQVARDFGSVRTPLSGSTSRHTASDSLHPRLFIEVKTRISHSACRLYDLTKEAARTEKKIPIVALVENGRPGYRILIDPADLIEVALEYQKETS